MEGVIREVIEASGAGLAIPPGDPAALAKGIIYLADHKEESREIGSRGREYVKQHFDRPIQAEKFATVIENLPKANKV